RFALRNGVSGAPGTLSRSSRAGAPVVLTTYLAGGDWTNKSAPIAFGAWLPAREPKRHLDRQIRRDQSIGRVSMFPRTQAQHEFISYALAFIAAAVTLLALAMLN